MGARTLLFGLGVTRSGSTWLHTALRAHPQMHMRPVKEAHWFDTLDAGNLRQRIDKWRAMRAAIAARRPDDPRLPALDGLVAAMEGGGDDTAYLGWLGDGAPPRARVLGDITPAYGLLPAAMLARMQALAADTRFLIVLRDPLARLLSNVRLTAARAAQDAAARADHAARALRRWLAGRHATLQARSDYAGMFARLDRAIAPDRLLVLFFERLFDGAALRRLTDWLGLAPHRGALPARVHEGARIALDPELVARAHARLAPQYAFARARFGADIPSRWDAPMHEV